MRALGEPRRAGGRLLLTLLLAGCGGPGGSSASAGGGSSGAASEGESDGAGEDACDPAGPVAGTYAAAINAAGFVIDGARACARPRLAGVGDFNGDGLSDMLLESEGGRAHVVLGRAAEGRVFLANVEEGVGGLVIEPGDQRPHGWSMAGDVNGDGRADLVARSELPQTLMVFGVADSLPIDLDAVAAGAGGLRIELGPAIDPAEGVRSPALGGRPLADLSGDGLGDLAFALPAGDGSEPGSGRVALIFGRSEWGGDVAFNYVAHGERAGDRFGEDVAVADVNGDGDDDLIISAPRADPQGPESGRVYVLFGPLP